MLIVAFCLVGASVFCFMLRRRLGSEFLPSEVKGPITIIIDGRQKELAAGSVETYQLLAQLENASLRRNLSPTRTAVNGKIYQILIPAGDKNLQWEVIADDTGCDVNISDGKKEKGWHILSDTKALLSLLEGEK